jgi:prepilin-type N-terminal cleavage/methylation domain-containing protein
VNAIRARVTAALGNDRGMTLIEVVVAITILAVLSTASLGVYLSGINSATAQQRREVAVTVANSVLEDATLTAPANLYVGRSQAVATNLLTLNQAVPSVKQTFAAFQPPPVAAVPALKPTQTVTLNGTDYQVSTIVGTCFQKKAGGSCTVGSTYPTQPATPADSLVLTRIVVVVRWSAGSTCAGDACVYDTSTLVDRNSELTWNIVD